jgi:cytochrome c oxidase subunit 2
MPLGFSFFPPQASTLAPEIDDLYLGVVATTAFFALMVVIFVVYVAIKYRYDPGEKVGASIPWTVPLELGWSLIPFVISIGIFVWVSIVFFHS